MISMRNSRVLRKLRAGEVVVSVKLNIADPRVAEMAAMSGFDCVWLDNEHVPTDWDVFENSIRAAKIHDADAVGLGNYYDDCLAHFHGTS